jgi:transcriptional regulator with XRE-family HTH domain
MKQAGKEHSRMTPLLQTDPEAQDGLTEQDGLEEQDALLQHDQEILAQRRLERIPLDTIVFDEGLYPRVEGHMPSKVQTYVRDMPIIEAAGKFLSVNAENKLIDGRHRHLAYRKIYEKEPQTLIQVYRYAIVSPLETFRLALALQDRGAALTEEDRLNGAKKLYGLGLKTQAAVARALGVTQQAVSLMLARTRKEEKERQQRDARALWLACQTQEAIAERVGVTQQTIANWMEDFTKLQEPCKLVNLSPEENAAAWHVTDFKTPVYNIWRAHDKTNGNGVEHHGNSEVRWLDNLLYFYTQPFDIVVDPFAGSGSTIEICKKRFRRYWVSDRKPLVEQEHQIRTWDVTTGTPPLPRWGTVKLVYLDPPYWKQAEGEYSEDSSDLGNMDLPTFTTALTQIITAFSTKLSAGAVIALVMQPTQWRAPARVYTDHVAAMLGAINLPLEMRYSVPYTSQQYNAAQVDWAKANKQCLVLTREILVWRMPTTTTAQTDETQADEAQA